MQLAPLGAGVGCSRGVRGHGSTCGATAAAYFAFEAL